MPSLTQCVRRIIFGGVVQDAKVEYLKSSAITNIREVLRDKQNPPRLFLKREDPNYIDLWITSYYSGLETAKATKAGPYPCCARRRCGWPAARAPQRPTSRSCPLRWRQ